MWQGLANSFLEMSTIHQSLLIEGGSEPRVTRVNFDNWFNQESSRLADGSTVKRGKVMETML